MSNIFTLPVKKTSLCKPSGQKQVTNSYLSVAFHNPIMANTGRTTTAYKVSDDINDPAQTGSFFLLPDPYSKIDDSEENSLLDLISEEEEMMLYDHPINTNPNLYKI